MAALKKPLPQNVLAMQPQKPVAQQSAQPVPVEQNAMGAAIAGPGLLERFMRGWMGDIVRRDPLAAPTDYSAGKPEVPLAPTPRDYERDRAWDWLSSLGRNGQGGRASQPRSAKPAVKGK